MTKGHEALDRRNFVREAGLAVLTVQLLPLMAHASRNPPVAGNEADNLIVHSGPGLMSHVHDLLIPYAVLKAPPGEGVTLETTKALFHTHTIVLTQKQLMAVNQGETVTTKSSSHLFVIAMARQDPVQAGSGKSEL